MIVMITAADAGDAIRVHHHNPSVVINSLVRLSFFGTPPERGASAPTGRS